MKLVIMRCCLQHLVRRNNPVISSFHPEIETSWFSFLDQAPHDKQLVLCWYYLSSRSNFSFSSFLVIMLGSETLDWVWRVGEVTRGSLIPLSKLGNLRQVIVQLWNQHLIAFMLEGRDLYKENCSWNLLRGCPSTGSLVSLSTAVLTLVWTTWRVTTF